MVIPQKVDESITIVNEEESNESSSVVSMEEIPITKDDLKTSSDEEEEELEQDAHVNRIDKSISTKDAEHLELKLQHQKNMLDRDRAIMKRKTEQVKQQLEAKINIQEEKHKKKQAKLMSCQFCRTGNAFAGLVDGSVNHAVAAFLWCLGRLCPTQPKTDSRWEGLGGFARQKA